MHSNRIEQKVGKNLKLASGHERLSAGCNVSHLEIGEALKREWNKEEMFKATLERGHPPVDCFI